MSETPRSPAPSLVELLDRHPLASWLTGIGRTLGSAVSCALRAMADRIDYRDKDADPEAEQ